MGITSTPYATDTSKGQPVSPGLNSTPPDTSVFSLSPNQGRRPPDVVLSFCESFPHPPPPGDAFKNRPRPKKRGKRFCSSKLLDLYSSLFSRSPGSCRAAAKKHPHAGVVRSMRWKQETSTEPTSTLRHRASLLSVVCCVLGETNVAQDDSLLWVHFKRTVEKTIFTSRMSRSFQ